MKILLQRVSAASVVVENRTIAETGQGLLLLCGFAASDTIQLLPKAAAKIANIRIFSDEKGRFDRSLLDLNLGVIAVPQFPLYGDTSKGRRPEFFAAMEPRAASELFDQFVEELQNAGIAPVGQGKFGAEMQVHLTNDGPVTLMLEF